MGLFDQPDPETIQRSSQASPLADSLVQLLARELGGAGGRAFGAQRETGTALRQFLNSGGFNINLANRDRILNPDVTIPESVDQSGLVTALENVQNRRVNEQAADLRESFGAAGDRFGTALATGEGRFRRDAEADFTAQLGQLLEGARRFDVGARTQAELGRGELGLRGAGLDVEAQQRGIGNFLQGLQLQDAFALNNLLPFLQIGSQGIIPEDVVVKPNPWLELFKAVAPIGAAAAGNAPA